MTNTNPLVLDEKPKRLPVFDIAVIAFFLYYYLLPSASASLPFMLMLGLGMLYIAYVIFMGAPSKKALHTILKFLFVVVLIALYYYFFTVTLTVSTEVENYELKRFISKFQQMFFTAFPLLLAYRALALGTKRQQAFLLIFAAVLVVYVIIQSIGELSVNETASRVWGEFADMSEKNVGTYNFVYAVAITLPAVFATAINAKHWAFKVILAALLVFGIVFLVMAQYTISLLIAVALCFLGLFFSAKKLVTKVIVLILCPTLFLILPSVLEFFANNVAGGSMSKRLLEIADYFTGETMGYNLGGRFKLYKGTIDAFRASPLIGASGLEFDGHATFLTVLADIGIVGGIPFYWLYFSMRKHIGLLLKDKVMTRCFLLSFLAVILTGFLNPIHAALPLPMMAWLIVPLMINVLIVKKETEDGNMEN